MDLNSETNSNDIYKNKDFAIQIIRVISMLFIIICHLCDYSNNPYISSLGQFFNIGVFIFLFISGFLYGSKKIDNNKKWLFHRLKKIMVPVYVFVCFFILFNFILTKFLNLNYFFIYLLDLQYFFGSMPNIGHLWFCTIIMICYLLLPLMNIKLNLI